MSGFEGYPVGKRYTPEELQEILRLHALWLDKAEGGQRADLSGGNLTYADLVGADLPGALWPDADLRGVDLSDAKLSGADLCGADLSYAYLSGAYLSGAHLTQSNLLHADLRGAELVRADLSYASLQRADLSGVDLTYAKMRSADLSGVDLRGAYLSYVDLTNAKLTAADLRSADLTGTDLTNATLAHAVLTHATLPDNFAELFPDIAAKLHFVVEKDGRIHVASSPQALTTTAKENTSDTPHIIQVPAGLSPGALAGMSPIVLKQLLKLAEVLQSWPPKLKLTRAAIRDEWKKHDIEFDADKSVSNYMAPLNKFCQGVLKAERGLYYQFLPKAKIRLEAGITYLQQMLE
jgi:uncharacterized protein YjbI with pentapeptide repeats